MVVLIIRSPSAFLSDPLKIVLLVAAFLAGGAAAGFVIGMLYPIVDTFLGRVIVSTVAILPVGLVLGMLVIDSQEWAAHLIIFALAAGAIFGPIYGVATWISDRRK
jgi:hypothetical protein